MTPVGSLRSPYPSTDFDSVQSVDRLPVVFIHGLWLHASSWDPWLELFRERGYEPVAPGWPGEPEALPAANAFPDPMAGTGMREALTHFEDVISGLPRPPVLVGHAFGGLLAQQLLARGSAAGAAAIAPAQFRGVRRLSPGQLRTALPVLWNPLNRYRILRQSPQHFRKTFANAVTERESNDLHATCVMPAPGRPLFQAAAANLNPRTPVRVDTAAARGPLLLAGAGADRVVPASVVRAAARRYRSAASPTEYVEIEGSGHSLVVDHGWRIVAETVLGFLARHGLTPEAADR
ncbi:alpha/beta hydrolase [Arthrobacter sp. zg-Y820]|uniref:alpha/beta hydrolase n=1 Tax=unclassified Arthrobacter TaxID=235627 RepID=UPI001E2F4E5C|nr:MULTISPECIES: alpha/beta hydrolase [unclassified Arthrobacter]MCC9196365.1 alpha/beta hydrolase [Arthrobacter sp. zg-Y820]MDK1279226.1 alpha/beta hydrolase [Arthrobacter sp. zg.Y820]WIB08376.1 alpha/beta hydrolase [Arthrobacter sp. zg-Y820]